MASARHIVVDGRELIGQPTGVGRYLMNILAVWAKSALPHRISVIVPGEIPAELAAMAPAIAVHAVTTASIGTWFEQVQLPGLVRDCGGDVFFAPAYTAPLRLSCPFVLTVHDVSFFAHPEWFSSREGFRRRWLTRASAAKAATVTTVSNFSADEIVKYLGVARDRILVAPNGAPDLVAGYESAGGLREPMVLFVGTLLERRHVRELIHAFAAIIATVPSARLVIVGQDRATPAVDPLGVAAAAGISARVTWKPYVADTELDDLYHRAGAFVFVSDYEGFAMTPMEAIAKGTPVVVADTAVAHEIYGDGALFAAPTAAAIAQALRTLLCDDRSHDALLARGRAQLARFSWTDTARSVLTALESA